jgi:cysteine desulfurase/selenocysteine lyase
MNPDTSKIRSDFPNLQVKVNNKPLVYLDNAATTHKPKVVLEALNNFYASQNSNAHSEHTLASQVTQNYENARENIKKFLNAGDQYELIFTKSATEAINLVASSFGEFLPAKSKILLTETEHHANLVPWQVVAQKRGLNLDFLSVTEAGELDLSDLEKKLINTSLVSFVQISNVLGTINPAAKIISKSHQKNIPVLIDGTQAIQHLEVDIDKLDPDFYVFSGHKVFGPLGVGCLIAKKKYLEKMPPYQTGGDMIREVFLTHTTYAQIPHKFEAGTQNFAGIIALEKALQYLAELRQKYDLSGYEKHLLELTTSELKKIPGLKIFGDNTTKASIISFYIEGVNNYDLGTLLDLSGIAIRVGQHCTQPLLRKFGLESVCRISPCFYNTEQEILFTVDKIREIVAKLKS